MAPQLKTQWIDAKMLGPPQFIYFEITDLEFFWQRHKIRQQAWITYSERGLLELIPEKYLNGILNIQNRVLLSIFYVRGD